MPIQNSTPDLFFLSGGNYNVFLKWVQDTRQSLLALNKNTPNNENAIVNIDAVKSFVQTATISTSAQLSSTFEQAVSDQLINTDAQKTFDISDSVAQYSQQEMDGFNGLLTSEQQNNAKAIPQDNIVRNQLITSEIKNRNKSDFDINNPVPEDKRVDASGNNAQGYSNSYPDSDTGGVKTPAFPKIGEEYNNHAADITDRMNNLDKFEVFTGFKSKAAGVKADLDTIFKSWVIQKGTDKSQWVADPSTTFTPERPYSDYANEVLDAIQQSTYPGSYKFFIEKLHGRYSDLTPYKINKIKSQKKRNGNGGATDQNLSNRMVFSAYIDNYNDGYSVSSSEYNFLGRAEGIPIYKGTKRKMTMEFTILADYSAEYMAAMEKFNEQLGRNKNERLEELLKKLIEEGGPDWGLGEMKMPKIYDDGRVGSNIPGMFSDTPESLWNKLTFLAQCVYPFYREDGKMKEQPMLRVRIADFYDVILFPENLNIQMNQFDGPLVDMNPSSLGNMPFGVKITLDGMILHNYEPSSEFYGFYNRREFDEGTKDPITGLGIDLGKDKIQSGTTKHSPLNFDAIFSNEKLLNVNDLKSSVTQLKNNLQTFQSSFSDLTQTGTKLKTAYAKQKTQESIEAFQAVNSVVNHLRALNGLPPATSNANLNPSSPNASINPVDNLGTSSLSQFKQVVQGAQDYKQKFELTIGAVASTAQTVQTALTSVNNDLEKVGINVLNNADVKKALDTANKAIPRNIIPATIGDMLNRIKGDSSIIK